MAIQDHQGVRWLERTLSAAQDRGVDQQVSDLALAYCTGGAVTTYPDPSGQGRVRVVGDGVAAVLGPDHVVIGFRPGDFGVAAAVVLATQPRVAGGRSGSLGPTSITELIEMAEAEGAVITRNGSGHWSATHESRRISFAATPRSEAGVRNATARLRRKLGLRLRRA